MVWILTLKPFAPYGSSLGGLCGFLALGSLAPLSTLDSSRGLGLIASALARWLALALALGWVSGAGFLGGSGVGSLALVARSQRWRFLRAGMGIFSQISRVVLAGGRVLIKLRFPSRHPPFRKKSNLYERCQYLLFSLFLHIVCQFY